MSAAQAKLLNIAAIGDEELVSGLRLAGANRYYIMKGDTNIREDVRKALSDLISEPNIGVIIILEEYVEYIKGILSHLRESKRITPVIIEAPPKSGTKYKDITRYYNAFIKASIGFDIEI